MQKDFHFVKNSKRNNSIITKVHWQHLKTVFFRTIQLILTKLSQNIPWYKEFQFFFRMKGFTIYHVEIKSRNTLSLSKVFSKINLLMLTKLDRYVMPNTCHRTFKGKSNFYFKDVLKEFQIYLYVPVWIHPKRV